MKHLEFSGIKTNLAISESFYTINTVDGIAGKDFYFLSNDVYKYKLKVKDKNKQCVFVGIANPHYFHVLAEVSLYCNIVKMIAIDNNFSQLAHFNYMRQLICSSDNRIEYLQALFKVQFGAKAVRLLSSFNSHPAKYIHGGVESDKFYDLEKAIWSDLNFDAEAFSKTYGIDAKMTEGGVRIKANTIGDINTYFATIICCSKNNYEYWPFTAAFGSGFLRDEESFCKTKNALLGTPVYQILGDISDVYENILLTNRYSPTIFFSSNLLCDYFAKKHPALRRVVEISRDFGTRRAPSLPELDLIVIQDDRTKIDLPPEIIPGRKLKRKFSIHTKSFSAVNSFLRGTKNIEVVNMPSWIAQDKGVSKLPNTEYILADDFERIDKKKKFTSIFLHILVGHGMPEKQFFQLAKKALIMTNNLIVLEHNKESRDFKKIRVGLSVNDLKNQLGMEDNLTFCHGKTCKTRNILAVYGSVK